MKRLLAAGSGSIYQICHAFRAGEKGRRHHPEFTLLEWYRVGFTYHELMDDVESLINKLSARANRYQRITYRDVMFDKTGIDIERIELAALRSTCADLVSGCDVTSLSFDQSLDLLVSMVVAPALQGFVFIYDYPVSQAALARVNAANPRVAERFELFYGDLELANGFSELTDARTQSMRFEQDNRQRAEQGLPLYPVDDCLIAALEAGLPECAGVALGLERLLMVLLDLDSIDQVLSFCE